MRVALILVGLGTLAAMEFETPPRTTKPVNEPPAQVTVGLRASNNTLTTADRLEIPHMQFEAPQPVSSSEPMPPADQTAIVAPEPSKIIEQHKRSASGGSSVVILPRPRPRQGTSKATTSAQPHQTGREGLPVWCLRWPIQSIEPVYWMPDLAQRFLCIGEMPDGNPRLVAHGSEQTGRGDEIRQPRPDERGSVVAARDWLSAESITLVLGVAIGLAFVASFVLFGDAHLNRKPIDTTAAEALVERMIIAESNGDPNARNKRSSATGAAQFLNDTWLEAVRRHRRDLIQGRSDKEVLDLRRDAELAREITARLVEEYAAMLNKRGLPITPGSLYLAHFAGPAGAVALLSGAETVDAASLMAAADVTGRTTREKLVNANPFLKVMTVGDIKSWADRKMAVGKLAGRS